MDELMGVWGGDGMLDTGFSMLVAGDPWKGHQGSRESGR